MEGALWSLVAAFIIVLQVAADIPVHPNVDIPKLRGRWRARGVVVDSGEVTSTLRYRAYVKLQQNGDVIVTKKFSITTNCKDLTIHLKASGQPGKFVTASEGNVLRVVDTDYDGYCIFHVQASPRNELHLYTRERNVSNVAKEKFSAAAASLGFNKDKIVYRTKTGSCPN